MWDFTSHCSCITAPPTGYAARYQLLGNWGEKTPKRFTPMSHVQPHEGTWHYTLVQSLKLVFSSLIWCSIFSFLLDVRFYLTHILQHLLHSLNFNLFVRGALQDCGDSLLSKLQNFTWISKWNQPSVTRRFWDWMDGELWGVREMFWFRWRVWSRWW